MKLKLLIAFALLAGIVSAQTNLVSYEYWFNNDYANVQTVNIAPTQIHVLNTNLDVSALPNNVNLLHIRYKDENGKYGSTLSKLFMKLPVAEIPGTSKLVSYEYWFNNDYAKAQTVAVSPSQTHVLNAKLDITALPNNINLLNIRYKDGNGKYGTTLSKLFMKLPVAEIPGTSKLVSYEYWFNNDYAKAQTVAVSPSQTHVLNANLDITALPNHINLLNIRYKDGNGKYGSTLSKLFMKLPVAEIPGTSKLVSYEYWFNNDYANAQTIAVSPSQTHVLDANLDVTALPSHVNLLNIRYKNENGQYSSTLSKLFVKLPAAEVPGTSKLVSYEYWFNNDYANAQTVAVSPSQTHVLDANLDVTALPNNVNLLNIRYKDGNGKYGSTLSKLFMKLPNAEIVDNKLTDYMYWFDDDFENAITVTLPENVKTHHWAELLTLPGNMAGGDHEINIRFKDSLDMWSIPFTKAFVKDYNPRAEFDGVESELCLGTMLEITPDAIIDADSIYWDFGDGTEIKGKTATSLVQHLYASAGTYTVTATMKHTTSGVSNDTTLAITVHPAYGIFKIVTENLETTTISNLLPEVNLSICESELPYSFGSQSLTASGTYTEIFQTVHGCDSTVTLNLTVNSVDVSVTQIDESTLKANAENAAYQWVDCNNDYAPIEGETNQSFTATQNGSYAVVVSQNNCTDMSDCYDITLAEILENTFDNNITVYPNPTDGILIVNLGETVSEFAISITDVSGKLLKQSTYKNTQKFELNLDVNPCFYLLTIQSKNKKAIIRLIKN